MRNDDTLRDSVRAIREIIRRAILTFKALPDPDARFLRQGHSWQIVRDASEAYGYAEASVKDFQPTPHEIDQAMIVLPWLSWLWEEEGGDAVKRIIAWAMGIPMWRLAQREHVSERTIDNRIDRSVTAIINNVIGTDFRFAVVDEPYKSTPFAMSWDTAPTRRYTNPLAMESVEKPAFSEAFAGTPHRYLAKVTTVYVYGKGLMRNGKKWEDGRRKAEKLVERYA